MGRPRIRHDYDFESLKVSIALALETPVDLCMALQEMEKRRDKGPGPRVAEIGDERELRMWYRRMSTLLQALKTEIKMRDYERNKTSH